MNKMRFRYALEPVLLTRRWTADSLRLLLAECNARVAAHALVEAEAMARYETASSAWHAIAFSGEVQAMQRFGLNLRYLGELARQLKEHAGLAAELLSDREDAIAQLVSAQRAVEAAEQHRDGMKKQFIQRRAGAEFKLADDQWNTRPSGDPSHGQ